MQLAQTRLADAESKINQLEATSQQQIQLYNGQTDEIKCVGKSEYDSLYLKFECERRTNACLRSEITEAKAQIDMSELKIAELARSVEHLRLKPQSSVDTNEKALQFKIEQISNELESWQEWYQNQ